VGWKSFLGGAGSKVSLAKNAPERNYHEHPVEHQKIKTFQRAWKLLKTSYVIKNTRISHFASSDSRVCIAKSRFKQAIHSYPTARRPITEASTGTQFSGLDRTTSRTRRWAVPLPHTYLGQQHANGRRIFPLLPYFSFQPSITYSWAVPGPVIQLKIDSLAGTLFFVSSFVFSALRAVPLLCLTQLGSSNPISKGFVSRYPVFIFSLWLPWMERNREGHFSDALLPYEAWEST